MEEIKDIINSIVRGCSQAGVEVPEVLAAFVARTVRDNQLEHSIADSMLSVLKNK
jgi:hypothetical protein